VLDQKIKLIRERMVKEGISMLVLSPGPHMAWLFDFYPLPDERPCFSCLSLNNLSFLVPSLNLEQFRSKLNYSFYTWQDEEGPNTAFMKLVSEMSLPEGSKIAVDETMRADFLYLIQDTLPKTLITFSKSTVGYLRMLKTECEYQKLKKSALVADNSMKAALENISPKISELEVSAIINQAFHEQGARPAFSLVASGSNAAFPHHHSCQDTLEKGKPVIIDIGGVFGEYFSDMTRMIHIGEPSDRYLFIHNVVEEALQAALDKATIGTAASEVDNAARKVIEIAGFGEYFVHRTGHGLGLEIHEPPYITSSSEVILEEGMVFTIEPGIYMPGDFGVRLEEVVYLSKNGPRILSGLSRELFVID